MKLAIDTRQSAGATILDLSGRLIFGDEADLLRGAVLRALDDGHRAIVLNLAEVSYMDSSGLGMLMTVRTSVMNRQGEVVLLNPSPKANRLLLDTKLSLVFDMFDTEAAAVAAVMERAAAKA